LQHKSTGIYTGVDISSLQTIVDEELLFSQIDFIIVRAFGRDHTGTGDSKTADYIAKARAHACPIGCYYFGFPFVDAAAGVSTDAEIAANAEIQAQQFIDKLYLVFGQGNVGDIIPMLDVEQYSDIQSQYGHTATNSIRYPQEVMTGDQFVTWVLAFKNYFMTNTGYLLGMYTGEYWLQAPRPIEGIGLTGEQIALLNENQTLPLWIARYDEYSGGADANVTVADFGNYTEYVAWQYTGLGVATDYGCTESQNNIDLNRTDDVSRLYAKTTADTPPAEPNPINTGIFLGDNSIGKIFLGNTPIDKLFQGVNEIYGIPVPPITTISPSVIAQNTVSFTVTLTTNELGAAIYYKIGAGAATLYTAPFTVSQNIAGSAFIPVTYWAVGANGTETERTITYDTTGAIPSAPVVSVTNGVWYVRLNWSAATNATSYSVFRSEIQGELGVLVSDPYQTALFFDDNNATGGTTYYYTVKASNYNNVTNSEVAIGNPTVAEAPTGFRYIRQWMNGGWTGSANTAINALTEFQAISTAGGNVLLNKVNLEGWVGKLAGTTNPPATITDGVTNDMWNYCLWSDSTGSVPQKITYDMGALYEDLTSIKTWHNYSSTGRYYNFKIEVCATNSANAADWTVVVDRMTNTLTEQDVETSAGLTYAMP
jgi:GH25 family lysozyme M1 (1,4-beta-N-acetylmuramidase)